MEDPTVVSVGIPVIALAIASVFVVAHPVALRWRASLGVTAWILIVWMLAGSGLLARFDARPPPLALFMGVIIVGSIAFGASRLGTPLLNNVSLGALIAFQAFRLPLELILHEAGRSGLAPTALTFSGYNFDIVTGVTAIIVAPLAARHRRLALAWNILGTALLAVIAGIAIATAPFVRALGDDQVNTWVTQVPYVLLPAVLVAAALIGHVLVFRKLIGGAPPA